MSSVLDELPAAADTGPAASARRWVHPRARHPAFVSAAFFAVVLLTVAGGLAWRNARIEQRAADDAVAAGRAATGRAAQTLDAMLRAVPLRINDLRAALENGNVRPDQVPALLTGLLETEMAVSGYGVAFEPDVAATRLFAPYIERGAARSMPLETDLGTLYDYTDFRYGWYRNTLLDGAGWQETNIFPDTGDVAVIYAVPFTLPGATTASCSRQSRSRRSPRRSAASAARPATPS